MAPKKQPAKRAAAARRPGSTGGGDVVKAEPTKEFFVSMLVRDIELMAAVVDLVDNSVDGARRHRPNGDYSGLAVTVTADPAAFVVADNCGGIPIDVARNYAFRFGRQANVERDKHSIGQFGVGMKRALFKLGDKFEIASKTTTDSFLLSVDVVAWAKRTDVWDFTFDTHAEGEKRPFAETGTTITARDLHTDVKNTFGDQKWATDLTAELRLKHRDALTRGLRVHINGQAVVPLPLDVVDTAKCRPAKQRRTFRLGGGSTVAMALVAGLSKADHEAAGWYVFCNGRMVLGPDKTDKTTWLGERSGRRGLPRYHDEYARFRGIVYFESDDPAALPWTTTKVGVDQDARTWIATREVMSEAARDVVQFLRTLDRERDDNPDVIEMLDELKPIPIEKVKHATGQSFSGPALVESDEPDAELTRVSYKRAKTEVAEAKRLLGVKTNGAVGEATFEYFMDAESS